MRTIIWRKSVANFERRSLRANTVGAVDRKFANRKFSDSILRSKSFKSPVVNLPVDPISVGCAGAGAGAGAGAALFINS
jgi:hypothetical protein